MKPSKHYHEFWLGFAFGAFAPAAFIAGSFGKEVLVWLFQ